MKVVAYVYRYMYIPTSYYQINMGIQSIPRRLRSLPSPSTITLAVCWEEPGYKARSTTCSWQCTGIHGNHLISAPEAPRGYRLTPAQPHQANGRLVVSIIIAAFSEPSRSEPRPLFCQLILCSNLKSASLRKSVDITRAYTRGREQLSVST